MDAATTATAVGITSSLLCSGVFFSSSWMVVPMLYDRAIPVSTSIFSEFYYRGLATVAPLSAIAAVGFGTAAYFNPARRNELAVAAALSLTPLVWTRFAMQTTIETLLKASDSVVEQEKLGGQEVVRLLKQWVLMNYVRVFALGGAGATGLWTVLDRS